MRLGALIVLAAAAQQQPPRMRCQKERITMRQIKQQKDDDDEEKFILPGDERRRLTTNDDFVLLFIHVFKAAGSSMRTLLRRYAEKCQKRWACLVTCTEGGAERNGVVQCRLRDVVNLQRQAVFGRPPGRTKLRRNPSSELLGQQADVLGGHFYYGMHTILGGRRQCRNQV